MREMANFVVRLVKTTSIRLKKGLLLEAVLWQLRGIQQICCWGEVDYKPRLDELSPLMNCIDGNDELNVKALIGFHIDNSALESLSTFHRLYSLSCSQEASLTQVNRENTQQAPFFEKLKQWLRSPHGRKYSPTYLQLVGMESETILFNLMANQLYQMLRMLTSKSPQVEKKLE